MNNFIITGFHPLNVTLPPGEEVVGKIRIVLPPIHVKVYDLSMGIDLLHGAHLGSDVPILGLDLEATEPVPVEALMAFIVKSKDDLEQIWKLGQTQFDKKGALLG